MSDIFWQAVIGGIVTVALGYMTMRTQIAIKKASDKAEMAAETAVVATERVAKKAEQVRTTLEDTTAKTDVKLTAIAKVAKDTHTLVNSNMGVQLKLGMDLSDFKAKTTKLPEDISAAKLARTMYEEHVKKQAVVDNRKEI